jgi:beta-lactamase regulating signal transducer with metallopeptidase domain
MAALVTALVNGFIVSAVATAFVAIVMSLCGNRLWNAATRYAIWWALLVFSLAVMLPSIRFRKNAADERIPAKTALHEASLSTPSSGLPAVHPSPPPSRERLARLPLRVTMDSWMTWIAVAWFAAAAVMLSRLLLSAIILERRKTNATRIGHRQAGARRVQVALSRHISTPVAAGPLRPAILIPDSLYAALDAQELDQILLHECAHFERHDDYALFVERLVEAVVVFHPVIRRITRQIDLEREIACDDIVIARTGRPAIYAKCLTRVLELAGLERPVSVAPSAIVTVSHIERRIDMLLDDNRKKETRLQPRWLVSAVFLLFFAILMAPRVIRVEAQSAPVVRVPVVVTDALGRYISGLEVEHFRVLEGGVEQTLAASSILVTRHAPISLAVIMDVRAGAVNAARDAAARFLSTTEPDDEFFSIDSGGRPDTARPSSLLDVVRTANDRLRTARHPLKGIVIVSDGGEHTDTKAEAQSLAGMMDIPVFAINPKSTDDIMEALTKNTGGRYFSSLDSGDLVRIGVALRNYYVLEFASRNPSRDGTYRPIEVQVVPPRGISRLFAQYRTGYFAPSR